MFENLSRYSPFTKLTFRRHFATCFDWLTFNKAYIDCTQGQFIGIVDCSFLPKSGSKTFGLNKFCWADFYGLSKRGCIIFVIFFAPLDDYIDPMNDRAVGAAYFLIH